MPWPRPGSLPLASPRALGENVHKHTKEVKPGVSLGSAAAPTWLEMSLRWGIKRTHGARSYPKPSAHLPSVFDLIPGTRHNSSRRALTGKMPQGPGLPRWVSTGREDGDRTVNAEPQRVASETRRAAKGLSGLSLELRSERLDPTGPTSGRTASAQGAVGAGPQLEAPWHV